MLSKERTIECMEKFLRCECNHCWRMDCDECENNFSESWIYDVLPSALMWLKENGEEGNV